MNSRTLLTAKKGFTIVELITVIVVIGILVTVVVVSYNGIQRDAVSKSIQSDLDALDGLQTQYALKNNVVGKAWYSAAGVDADLNFTPSPGNVIDIVINSTDYCIRGYNTQSNNATLTAALKLGSSSGACAAIAASSAAIADSP